MRKSKQLQASGGCVKLTIDGYMLTLKEEASIEVFCLIRCIFVRNNYFDENSDVLFEYLMEFEIRCIDVNEAIKL
jgi:hypothetical protein